MLALKRKSDSEFERRGRIESIAFSQERKLIVMLGPGPEEQQEAAEEKIVRDLEKSYRRDLDDVIALLQDHRQQLQYCKMRADDLRFDKK